MIIYRGTNIALDLGFQPEGKEKAGLTSHSIEFSFELSEYVKLEKGDMIEFKGKKFYLPKNFIPVKNKNTDGFKYDLQFFDIKERFKDFILKYSLQGVDETSFKLTTSGDKFLDVVIYTLGKQGITLTKGQFPSEIKEINFENIDVFAGLNLIAETYKLEWWTDGTTLNLGKLEHGNPVLLRYDHELDDISFSQSSEKLITRLYAFGGTRNIPYNYRTETGAVDNIAEQRLRMPVDYIDLFENLPENQIIEGVEIFDDIYPKQNNKIVSVETVLYEGDGVETQDTTAFIIKGDNTFEITESDIEAGKPLKIAFTSGHLNGREFELIIKGGNKYEIKYTQDGNVVIPNTTLKPQIGDTFFFFNFKADVVLPTIIPEAENELLAHAKTFLNNIGSEYVYDVKTRSILCENMGIDLNLGQVVTIQSEELGTITSRVQGYEKDLYNKYEANYQIGDYSKYSRLREIEGRIKPPQKFDAETFQRTLTAVFRDGVVTETELRAVESQLTSLQTEKAQLNAQYVFTRANRNLINKTPLETAWSEYTNAYNDVYNSIQSAISDNEVTSAEKAEIQAKIDAYIVKIGDFNTELQRSKDIISGKIIEDTKTELEKKIPAIWKVIPVNTNPGAPFYVDEKAKDERMRSISLTVRYTRNGEDVSIIMAKSTQRLYTWGRTNPLGVDDNGVTDEDWTLSNANRDIVTLTPDDIMWVANIYTEFDPVILEQQYNLLK